jgi:hypothetical protein
MRSFAFSLRESSVISTVAVAPAGIVAPFDPVTVLLTVALKRWPTLWVFVHTRELELRLISVPAAIVPSLPSEPPDPFVTVFPLAVVVVAGALGVVERGVVRGGVLTTVPDDRGRVVVRAGAAVTGAVLLGVPVVGTS